MAGLIVLWSIVSLTSPTAQPAAHPSIALESLFDLVFVSIAAGWIYFEFFFSSAKARRRFRRDPMMQGEITVTLAPAVFAAQNSAGSSSQSDWSAYRFWREKKGVIVLVPISGSYFIVSLANLSEPQRAELRSILTAALPRK